MNQYKTAVDLRRAIEARLKSDAETKGTDYGRLRRIVVFDRIAARLSASDQGWVLKGGTALEFRLGLRARATKDLDLVLRSAPSDGTTLREVLIETLAARCRSRSLRLHCRSADRPGYRRGRQSRVAVLSGRRARRQDVRSRTRRCRAPPRRTRGHRAASHCRERSSSPEFDPAPSKPPIAASISPRSCTRSHATTAPPNTRVKDLLDLLLLIHDGLSPIRTYSR